MLRATHFVMTPMSSPPLCSALLCLHQGILSFCAQELRDLLDVKVFVKEDDDVRLARR